MTVRHKISLQPKPFVAETIEHSKRWREDKNYGWNQSISQTPAPLINISHPGSSEAASEQTDDPTIIRTGNSFRQNS
jgi:hypothetical protein